MCCRGPPETGISRPAPRSEYINCASTYFTLCAQAHNNQNGMVERLIRTLKEQCVHRHRFETLQHASRVIGDWVSFYNTRRPHQALGMKTPAMAFALAA